MSMNYDLAAVVATFCIKRNIPEADASGLVTEILDAFGYDGDGYAEQCVTRIYQETADAATPRRLTGLELRNIISGKDYLVELSRGGVTKYNGESTFTVNGKLVEPTAVAYWAEYNVDYDIELTGGGACFQSEDYLMVVYEKPTSVAAGSGDVG